GPREQAPALPQPRRGRPDTIATGSAHLEGSSTSSYQSQPAASVLPANALIELVLDGSQGASPCLTAAPAWSARYPRYWQRAPGRFEHQLVPEPAGGVRIAG